MITHSRCNPLQSLKLFLVNTQGPLSSESISRGWQILSNIESLFSIGMAVGYHKVGGLESRTGG